MKNYQKFLESKVITDPLRQLKVTFAKNDIPEIERLMKIYNLDSRISYNELVQFCKSTSNNDNEPYFIKFFEDLAWDNFSRDIIQYLIKKDNFKIY